MCFFEDSTSRPIAPLHSTEKVIFWSVFFIFLVFPTHISLQIKLKGWNLSCILDVPLEDFNFSSPLHGLTALKKCYFGRFVFKFLAQFKGEFYEKQTQKIRKKIIKKLLNRGCELENKAEKLTPPPSHPPLRHV